MNNINTKNIIKVIVIVMILLISLWFLFTWSNNSVDKLKIANSVISGAENSNEEKLNNMRKEIKDIRPYIDKFQELAVTQDAIPSILNDIELTGGPNSSIVISGVSIDNERNLIQISANTSCALDVCLNILGEVSSFRKMVGMSSINMREMDEGRWAVSMHIQIPLLEVER